MWLLQLSLCFFAVYLCCCSCLSVGQLFCLSRGLLVCLCLSSLSFNLSVSLSGILSVWRCFYRSVCLSSLHLSLSVSYSVCLSSLSVSRLSVTLSVCLSSYLCVSCCQFQFYHCNLQQLSIYSFLLISCMFDCLILRVFVDRSFCESMPTVCLLVFFSVFQSVCLSRYVSLRVHLTVCQCCLLQF